MEIHSDFMTPLLPLPRLSQRLGVDLWVKRDDLFPYTGGGNKARKVQYIAREIQRQEADSVVTTGGLQSNHARAVALMAAERGWNCKLILHGDQSKLDHLGICSETPQGQA